MSSSHDNGQSMVIYHSCMKYALQVAIVAWQGTENSYTSLKYETCSISCHRLMTTVREGYSSLGYETCSVSCHCLMTTYRARLIIPEVWNMLHQLSSSHDNGQSMVIYHSCMKHAPTVVIVSRQRSGHGNVSLMYVHASSVVIVSWQRTEHDYTSLRYKPCSVSFHRLTTTAKAL